MTNEYDSKFSNDSNKEYFTILFNNYDNEFFNDKKINQQPYRNQVSTPPTSPFLYASYEQPSSLSCDTSFSSCSSSSLSPILTPTTTISSSHSTLHSIPSSSLPTSPLLEFEDKSKFCVNENNENDDLSLTRMECDNESLLNHHEHSNNLSSQEQILFSMSENELLYDDNNYHDVLNIQSVQNHNIINEQTHLQTHLQTQIQTQLHQLHQLQQFQDLQNHYYNKERLRILSLIEYQQQQYLNHREFNDEQYNNIDPEFLNSNSNLFKWTFIKPKFPLLFDQMYDKANGCFFLAGIPVEFIFELGIIQDLSTDDNILNEDISFAE